MEKTKNGVVCTQNRGTKDFATGEIFAMWRNFANIAKIRYVAKFRYNSEISLCSEIAIHSKNFAIVAKFR